MPDPTVTDELARVAGLYAANARTPFSGQPAVAVVLLSDGTMVPGVRVESASFPLTIPAALNAITTSVAAGRHDMAALFHLGPVPGSTSVLAGGFGLNPTDDPRLWLGDSDLARPTAVIDPFMTADSALSPEDAVAWAGTMADRAYTRESNFPVAAVLRTSSGRWLPGVNVEHADWASILCAERNAVGTAVTFGERPEETLALTCPKAPGASPCGGCRQILAELAPDVTVWMDQGSTKPLGMSPGELLPLAFSGDDLSN